MIDMPLDETDKVATWVGVLVARRFSQLATRMERIPPEIVAGAAAVDIFSVLGRSEHPYDAVHDYLKCEEGVMG